MSGVDKAISKDGGGSGTEAGAAKNLDDVNHVWCANVVNLLVVREAGIPCMLGDGNGESFLLPRSHARRATAA